MKRSQHVVIVHQGEDIPSDPGYAPLRYGRLAAALTREGVRVTRVVPSFSHVRRSQRLLHQPKASIEGAVHVIETSSYEGSLSLDRARFTVDFLVGTGKFLRENRAAITGTLVGVPPPLMVTASRLGLGRGANVVADIRDVWPDCLAVGPREKWEPALKAIGKLVSQEMRLANTTLAVSQPMLNWSPRCQTKEVVPIGMADRELSVDQFAPADAPLRVCFISNHTMGFDFEPVLLAWRRFTSELADVCNGSDSPELVFIGAEPADSVSHRLAEEIPSVRFAGRIDAAEIGHSLSYFDVGLAPTTPRFGDSLSNKVFDYLATGLFVSHSIDPEVSMTLDELGIGVHVSLTQGAWTRHFHDLNRERNQLRSNRLERISSATSVFGATNSSAVLMRHLLPSPHLRLMSAGH